MASVTALQIAITYLFAVTCIIAWNVVLCKVVWKGSLEGVGAIIDPLQLDLAGWRPTARLLTTWGLLHVVFYANLAYAFPEYWPVLFVVGCVWEAIEILIKRSSMSIGGCVIPLTVNSFYESESWWDGRWQDIVLNTVGLLLGAGLAAVGFGWPKLLFGLLYVGVVALPFIVTAVNLSKASAEEKK